MRQHVKTLQNIVTRKGSSKILSFSAPHVFCALQILTKNKHASRALFCEELRLGEGAVRTLILHLKNEGLVDSERSGSFLTKKGIQFVKKFLDIVPVECTVRKCKIAPGRFNHAMLIRNLSKNIGNGMEQRDYAIMYGASGATTLIFKNNQFIFPKGKSDLLFNDRKTIDLLINELNPVEGDVVIITSANEAFVAKISAVNSVLWTLASTTS